MINKDGGNRTWSRKSPDQHLRQFVSTLSWTVRRLALQHPPPAKVLSHYPPDMASQSPTELMDHRLRMFLEGSQGTAEGQAMLMELVH
jgi:hypothetical protein